MPCCCWLGWWKVGYPEYFAKVPNAPSWTGIIVRIDGEELDLAKCEVKSFLRELDMKQGLLTRTFTAVMPSGRVAEVAAKRFLQLSNALLNGKDASGLFANGPCSPAKPLREDWYQR